MGIKRANTLLDKGQNFLFNESELCSCYHQEENNSKIYNEYDGNKQSAISSIIFNLIKIYNKINNFFNEYQCYKIEIYNNYYNYYNFIKINNQIFNFQ